MMTHRRVLARTLAAFVPGSAAVLLVPGFLLAQGPGQSIDIGGGGVGLSIGNAQRWTGVRINWRDRAVRRVTGLNLTLWKAGANPEFEMNGLALGLYGPRAAHFRGAAIGLGGVVAERRLDGIGIGGLGVVAEGPMHGVGLAGLGVVTQDHMRGVFAAGLGIVAQGEITGVQVAGLGITTQGLMRGITVAGLGTVAQGSMEGISFAGLGLVAQGDMTGINIGGLGTVSQGNVRGINVAGLGLVSTGDMAGINLAGIATVSQGELRGINVAGGVVVATAGLDGLSVSGLAVVSRGRVNGLSVGGAAVVAADGIRGAAIGGLGVVADGGPITGLALTLGRLDSNNAVRGLAFGGYRVRSPELHGIIASALRNRATDLTGIGIAGFNDIRGTQRGLAIGLYNRAERLHGVQVGLLNFAGNNSGPLRLLPLINLHFE